MRTIEKAVFKFAELSESAKEKARIWYRHGIYNDEWHESVFEDAAEIAEMMGIDLRQTAVKLMNGDTRYDPCIYFSGFSSQGDGACFVGTYRYKAGSAKAVKTHAPQDAVLHGIVDTLQAIQRKAFYRLTANITHRGHYNHSGCMDIDVERDGEGEIDENGIRECMTDFADWIYKQLESEWDYRNSDEQTDESIEANEYEFNEDGSIE